MRTAFLILCLLGANWAMSQTNPTIGEIYDFEIGDLFQYTITPSFGPAGYRQTSVIDKWYSMDSDTVYYEISESSVFPPSSQDEEAVVTFGELSVISYTDLDSVLTPLGPEPILLEVDSISSTCVVNFEQLGENYMTYNTSLLCADTAYQIHENYYLQECIPWFWGVDELYNSYARGLGLVKTVYGSWELGSGGQTNLTYVIKGFYECGNYNQALDIETINRTSELLIYPNPSSDGVYQLKFSGQGLYQVHSIRGMLIQENKALDVCNIDLSSYPSGVYFLTLLDRAGRVVGRERLVR